jgi:hypothetical protein
MVVAASKNEGKNVLVFGRSPPYELEHQGSDVGGVTLVIGQRKVCHELQALLGGLILNLSQGSPKDGFFCPRHHTGRVLAIVRTLRWSMPMCKTGIYNAMACNGVVEATVSGQMKLPCLNLSSFSIRPIHAPGCAFVKSLKIPYICIGRQTPKASQISNCDGCLATRMRLIPSDMLT